MSTFVLVLVIALVSSGALFVVLRWATGAAAAVKADEVSSNRSSSYRDIANGRHCEVNLSRQLGSNKASAHELITLEVQDVHLTRPGSWDASCALFHLIIERKSWGARKLQGGWC